MSPRSRQFVRLFLAIFLVCCCLRTAAPGDEPAQANSVKGLRVFICGHSFHMPISGPLQEISQSAGLAGAKLAGTQGLGGSQVMQHWNLPDDQNKVKKALRAGLVDVLTLAPNVKLPDEGIDNFTQLALEHNPAVRILVQASWSAFDGPSADRAKFKNEQRDDSKYAVLLKSYEPYYQSLAAQIQGLNNKLKGQQKRQVAYLVPVGHAVMALRQKVAMGQVPGISKQSDLFRDPIGHGKAPITALTAYCYFAVIYGRSPVGLAVPSVLKGFLKGEQEENLNRLLQEIAWNAVTSEPLTGVKR